MNELLQVENYRKVYDKVLAVDSLSFELSPGSVLGLVGPNGSGKTTTMRAIAGIIQPTDGRITVCGHDVVRDAKSAKKVSAFIPDDPQLFETLTVWEHLMFVASIYQIKPFEQEGERLIEQFELTEKRDALAGELSRGMRQKVAICCAYLQQPKLIMFDEPHTGLDPLAIRRMKETVLERAKDGATVIVSSHLLGLIEDLCTHLLILTKGTKKFLGRLEELRANYPEVDSGASLEEIFFTATSDNNKPSSEPADQPTAGPDTNNTEPSDQTQESG